MAEHHPRRPRRTPGRTNAILGWASVTLVVAGVTWIGLDALAGNHSTSRRPATTPTATTSAASTSASTTTDTIDTLVMPTTSEGGTTSTLVGSTTDETTKTTTSSTEGDTTASALSLSSLRGITVGVDAGHNGGNASHPSQINKLVDAGGFRKACDTTGTAGTGWTEPRYTIDVALRLRRILQKAGAKVVMVRTNNTGVGPCVNQRAAITNTSDVAVSIHADGNLGKSSRGFHVIYPADKPGFTDDIYDSSLRLAHDIRDEFGRITGLPRANYVGRDGLSQRGDLGGLNLSDTPKIFIETGNMRNAADMRRLADPAFREREARGIASGLAAWARSG